MLDGNIVIPPMHCAIFFSGEAKNELAEMVCDHIICPTVSTADSVAVRYENDIFADGYYEVNLIPFAYLDYSVDLIYQINGEYVDIESVEANLASALKNRLNTEQRVTMIKEDDIYKAIEATGITGINVLAVNLKVGGAPVDYIEVPVSKIARLASVNYAEG